MWLRSFQVLLTRTFNALYMLSPAHIATEASIGMSSYSCKHRPCAGHSIMAALINPWQRKPEHADTSSNPIVPACNGLLPEHIALGTHVSPRQMSCTAGKPMRPGRHAQTATAAVIPHL